MITNQSFSYTGSLNYDVNNIELDPNGVSLLRTARGVQGVDFVPFEGSTVSVKSGIISIDPTVKNFEPLMNNKAYYLLTNTLYTQDELVLAKTLSTEIAMTLVVDRYVGTFVYTNPSNYEYIYIWWDYTDNMDSGSVSYQGVRSTKNILVDFTEEPGNAGFQYNVNSSADPARFVLEWNGSVVGDTGYVGLNTSSNYAKLLALGIPEEQIMLEQPLNGLINNGIGSLRFSKLTSTREATITAYSPSDTNNWFLEKIDPSLTEFYISTLNGTLSSVCSQIANTLMYHNGQAALPINGDIIFTSSTLATRYNGSDAYHAISSTLLATPSGEYVAIGVDGVCYLSGDCVCSEPSAPVINQVDFSLEVGRPADLVISATNNPTSWRVLSNCLSYLLNGGSKGTIYTITDCDGISNNVTVNSSTQREICSSTTPVVVFGDGTFVGNGVCQQGIFPDGITFNEVDGSISGTPERTQSKNVTLIALNCAGPSIPKEITISTHLQVNTTPFLIDIKNFSDAGASACSVTPSFDVMYHDGNNTLPVKDDEIFTDSIGSARFNGGDLFYRIDTTVYCLKISSDGVVEEIHSC
jgi:hypothetical protein